MITYSEYIESIERGAENDFDGISRLIKYRVESPLRERIGKSYIVLNDYLKHDGSACKDEIERKLTKPSYSRPTGVAMLLNEIWYLGCVDIDIDHDLSEDRKEEIRQYILSMLSDDNVIEQTGNGGLHIYCQLAYFPLNKNRVTKALELKDPNGDVIAEIDLFGAVDRDRRSLVVFAGINGIETHSIKHAGEPNEELLPYRFIRGSIDSSLTKTMYEVLTQLGLTYTGKKDHKALEESENAITSPSTDPFKFTLDKEVIELLVAGIAKPMVCHNWLRGSFDDDDKKEDPVERDRYTALFMGISYEEFLERIKDGRIKRMDDAPAKSKELGLWDAFPGIYAIEDRKLRNEALDNLKSISTAKASFNFDGSLRQFERYFYGGKLQNKKVTLWYLLEMIKRFNPEYYETVVEPKHKGVQIRRIDFTDPFNWNTFLTNANAGRYKTLSHAATDLSKIFRSKNIGTRIVAEKCVECFEYLSRKEVKEKLIECNLFTKVVETDGRKKNVRYTAYDAFLMIQDKLSFYKFKFMSYDPDVLSIYHGYQHEMVDEIDYDLIDPFITLIKEVLCENEKEEAYEYIIKWIAWMLQNPGQKSRIGVILKGKQGAGKNTFAAVLKCLFYPYYGEVKKIESLTKFNKVIEGKMLIVANELKNAQNEFVTNIDALKSIVTDRDLMIESKHKDERESENVANFIFMSNHHKPIIIPPDDRRYFVLNVSGLFAMTMRGKRILRDLNQLCEKHGDGRRDEVADFFNHLHTFFMSVDVEYFDPGEFPMTSAKLALIERCFSRVDQFIVAHYGALVKGIPLSQVKALYKKDFVKECQEIDQKEFRNFQGQLKDKCMKDGQQSIRVDGIPTKGYKLKEEYYNEYDPERFKNKDDSDDQNEQSIDE